MDYFRANKLQVETFYVIRYSPDPSKPWHAYRYDEHSFLQAVHRLPGRKAIHAVRGGESACPSPLGTRSRSRLITQKAWAGEALGDTSALYKRGEKLIGWIPGAMSAAVFLRNLTKPRDIRTLPYVGRY